jgi:membrane protein
VCFRFIPFLSLRNLGPLPVHSFPIADHNRKLGAYATRPTRRIVRLGFAFAAPSGMISELPLSWSELARRTWREALDDDVTGLAAQLAYYFFLALFPAILFVLAIASFFPLANLTDDLGQSLAPFVSPAVLELIQEQMRRLANNENGGLLTVGVAGALWSSSAAIVSIAGALNRAYDIEEARPWWKVRLTAITLTVAVAVMVLVALTLVLVGPTLAEAIGRATGMGNVFQWTWLILQWPLVFALVATAIGLLYYFGPDADQDWVWITPGAIAATLLWLVASLLFKVYIANFTDYTGSYGTVGGVIVLLLWFYMSGLAILAGAELNAEIEHASPYGKAPGQKNAAGKLMLGRRAARAFEQRRALIKSSGSVEIQPVRKVEPTIIKRRSSADIQAELREKRARLDARIDELANRVDSAMHPGTLVAGLATTAVRSIATVRRVRTPMLITIAMTAIRIARALRSHRDQHRR